MLFSGSTFFLSTKLSLPDTRVLSEFIRNNGGTLAPNASDAKTITVVDSWEPVRHKRTVSERHLICSLVSSIALLTQELGTP